MPKVFLSKYGSAEEHDEELGMTAKAISKKLKKLLK